MQRSYAVSSCEGAPDWETIPAAQIDEAQWLPNPGVAAWAQVCAAADALFVRLFAREAEPLARFTGETDMICLDSCLEFFFCPLPDDTRYFNFEFNPNGALYLGFGHDRYDSVRQLVPRAGSFFCVEQLKQGDVWGIGFRIPYSFIRLYAPEFTLRPGLRLRGNFYHCGEETCAPRYLSWNRIHCETPEFHQPSDFGWLVF